MVTIDQARAAKAELRKAVDGVDGVCGVGLAQRGSETDWVLQVNVETVRARKDVPAAVEGVPVRVHVVGPVRAL